MERWCPEDEVTYYGTECPSCGYIHPDDDESAALATERQRTVERISPLLDEWAREVERLRDSRLGSPAELLARIAGVERCAGNLRKRLDSVAGREAGQ